MWFVVGVLFALFFSRSFFVLDPDFGWHLVSGDYIRANGLPFHDIFTYTASNFPWIHHEWLADIFTSIGYQVGGYALLAVLHAALWTAAFTVIGRPLRYRSLIILAAFISLPYVGVRAITGAITCSTVLILLLRSRRYYVFAPLLMLVWANVHGSFVMGLGYIMYTLLWRQRPTVRRVLVVLAAVAATGLTPYGFGVYTEVFRTAFDSTLQSRISEWNAWQVDPFVGVYVGLWLSAMILSYRKWTDVVRFDALLLLMSISSGRHIPLFALFSLAELGRFHLSKKIDINDLFKQKQLRILIALLTVLVLGSLGYSAWRYVKPAAARENAYAPSIMSYLRQHPCSGNVFNHYDVGGYMIWRLPGVPVYIDGRMPSWSHNGTNYMDRYLEVIDNPTTRDEEFAKYNIRCVVWYDNEFTEELLKEDDWKKIPIENDDSFILLEKN